jgi:hypothetical protein
MIVQERLRSMADEIDRAIAPVPDELLSRDWYQHFLLDRAALRAAAEELDRSGSARTVVV